MKFAPWLLLAMLFTVSIGQAEDDAEWVTVRRSQLWAWGDLIIELRSTVNEYSANITELELEIVRLKNEIVFFEDAYEQEKRGWFVGANVGHPFLSADFVIIYKFSRFGVYSMVGYNTKFTANIGFIARVSK